MTSIWKRLHEIHKNKGYSEDDAMDDAMDGLYIIPCDECRHFGDCKYEKQCNEDVKMGRRLEKFEEKR